MRRELPAVALIWVAGCGGETPSPAPSSTWLTSRVGRDWAFREGFFPEKDWQGLLRDLAAGKTCVEKPPGER